LDRRLFLLNGLAIIAVIFNHAAGWGYTAMIWWADRYLPVTVPYHGFDNSLSYYVLLLFKELTVFAVPAFLFVSGAFLTYAARTAHGTIGWKVVRARLMTLIPPYLIWSIAIFVGDWLQHKTYPPLEYLTRLLFGQATEAYFYVPVLLQFYILSPWIVRLAQKSPKLLLITAAILQWGLIAFNYAASLGLFATDYSRFIPYWIFPKWIFYFAIGVVAGFRLPEIKQRLANFKTGIIILLCVSAPMAVVEAEWLYHASGYEGWRGTALTFGTSIYALSVLAAFVGFAQPNMRFAKNFTQLGNKSYGIYLIHPKILEFIARILYHFAPFVLAHQILFQPILILCGLGIPLLIIEVVSRTPLRRFYRYAFG
jgi:probable poly-beta-1,6-N-acetyl-D-glucosamine export protein